MRPPANDQSELPGDDAVTTQGTRVGDPLYSFSPWRLVTPLLPHWPRLLAFGLAGGLAGVALGFALHSRYTATARFTAQSPSSTRIGNNLATLAGQFGLNLDLGVGGVSSPEFYADIVQTREVLEQVLLARYPMTGGTDSTDLLKFLRLDAASSARNKETGVKKLRRAIHVDVARSGMVTVNVTLNDPTVAAAVANTLIDRLNAFTVSRLQFQSRQQRLFAEERLSSAQQELHEAEQDEVVFLERNRLWEQSPMLRAQYARLQRVTQTKQDIVATLSRAYEEARLQEARDTPNITVVEAAIAPTRRSWPPRALFGLAGFFIGLTIASVGLWGSHWLSEARRSPEGAELLAAWRAAVSWRHR